ncbi:MAG TPA: dephospho-CoA kinase [Phycisphaerae bacterium]|nr:dephospho-CoA kinase [Phycisphaerae bacterium]
MPNWKNNRHKPVIGLLGGIGSGKSCIARQFASLGCAVIDSDAVAHEVLQTADVKEILRKWLGPAVFREDGSVSRGAVAARIFNNPESTARLNGIIHPRVAQNRAKAMAQFLADPAVIAIVWDTPLLLEAGLDQECDAVVFVKAPIEQRLSRIIATRGWSAEELDRREKLQIPLDKKADIADYCIDNSGDETSSHRQVQRVLSQILASAG